MDARGPREDFGFGDGSLSSRYALLSGAIASSTGEKLGGVTVSAKAAGQTITTTVFTDEAGRYYFPPPPTRERRQETTALSSERVRGRLTEICRAVAPRR